MSQIKCPNCGTVFQVDESQYHEILQQVRNEEFEKEVRPLITPSKTIEEEKDRLEKLIKLLEDRLEKRNDLEDRYYLATGDYISGLQIVISDKELDEKREEGIREGESLGENRINQLILKLSELNRTDEILKAAADREYQKKLLKEFGL